VNLTLRVVLGISIISRANSEDGMKTTFRFIVIKTWISLKSFLMNRLRHQHVLFMAYQNFPLNVCQARTHVTTISTHRNGITRSSVLNLTNKRGKAISQNQSTLIYLLFSNYWSNRTL